MARITIEREDHDDLAIDMTDDDVFILRQDQHYVILNPEDLRLVMDFAQIWLDSISNNNPQE